MPGIPTTNDGTQYFNRNQCRSYNQNITTALHKLSATPCAQVTIWNKSPNGNVIEVYDQNFNTATNAFILCASDQFTFQGITNCDQVSAKATGGTGVIYYRTQYSSWQIAI